jgi:hypothetical protein
MRNLLLFGLLLLLFSCDNTDAIDPALDNPLETNATLKRMVNLENKHNLDSCSLKAYSIPATKNAPKEYYYVLTNGSPILKYNFIPNAQIISTNGVDIGEFYDSTQYSRFFKEAKFEKTIWSKNKNIDNLQLGTCKTLNPMQDLTYFIGLKKNLDKYAWKSLIYQYSYKAQTIYYGIYTGIDRPNSKYSKVAAMTCDGENLQERTDWNQADFLANAILERQVH